MYFERDGSLFRRAGWRCGQIRHRNETNTPVDILLSRIPQMTTKFLNGSPLEYATLNFDLSDGRTHFHYSFYRTQYTIIILNAHFYFVRHYV